MRLAFILVGLFSLLDSMTASATSGMPRGIEFRTRPGQSVHAHLNELDLTAFTFQGCHPYAGESNGIFNYSARAVIFSFNQQVYQLVNRPYFYPGFYGHLISDAQGVICGSETVSIESQPTLRLVFASLNGSRDEVILTLDLAHGTAAISRNRVGESQRYLYRGVIRERY